MKHDLDPPSPARPGKSESQASRLRRRARSYLGQSVSDALSGTLGALGERIGQSRTPREDARVGKRRLEEVLERDRAQCHTQPEPVKTAPVKTAPMKATPSSPRERDDDLCGVEPIRTRTMARLLAEQGYTKRALALYDELIARTPDDASLREAAARLRGPRSA